MKPKASSPLSPHRQRKHDEMVQSILDTARGIMREQGVAALTMQELARRLDLRAPSLYYYFAGKMELYDTLFGLGFTLLKEHRRQYYEGAKTWQDFVKRSLEAYFTFAQQNPELYQLCFERPVPGFTPSEASLKLSFDLLNESYQQAQAFKNELHTDLPAQQVVDLVIAIMHGLTAMHLANEPDLPLGQGRFGSLIPAALEVLEKAWSPPR